MTISMTPAVQTVAPGAGFDIDLSVAVADSAFNGFDANIAFDPAAMTCIPASPISLQQGCLMTGACSVACGSTFHRFGAAVDSVAITDVLLCAGQALQGPGQLYRLHFVASNTPQVAYVRFHRLRAYNAGLLVNPIETHEAVVGIGVQLGVPGGQAPPGAPRVSAAPNPVRGSTSIRVESRTGGHEELVVGDVTGRSVRLLQRGYFAPGSRNVTWDGRDDRGAAVPAGVYFIRLFTAGQVSHTRVALLQ